MAGSELLGAALVGTLMGPQHGQVSAGHPSSLARVLGESHTAVCGVSHGRDVLVGLRVSDGVEVAAQSSSWSGSTSVAQRSGLVAFKHCTRVAVG